MAEVYLDCSPSHEQSVGDLGIRQSLSDQSHDAMLRRSETLPPEGGTLSFTPSSGRIGNCLLHCERRTLCARGVEGPTVEFSTRCFQAVETLPFTIRPAYETQRVTQRVGGGKQSNRLDGALTLDSDVS